MPALRHLLALVILAAVLAAGGCATVDRIIDETVSAPDRPAEPGTGPGEPGAKDTEASAPHLPASERASVPPSLSAARPPTSRRPVAPDSIATRELLGRTELGVVDLLGVPKTVRNEPPAMVWNYAAKGCKFDLFFYFDINNQDFRALSYKFDPGMKSAAAEELCLSAIRRQNAAAEQ